MDISNSVYILLIVFMSNGLVRFVGVQTCSVLQRCSYCYLANQHTCRNEINVDENSCARLLFDIPNVQKTKFTASLSPTCAYYTCSSTLLYTRSSLGTITYRLGCVNGCNNVTLTGYDSRGILEPADETIYSMTENECRSHCIDIAFNGTDCTAAYFSGICNIHTSCPTSGCTLYYLILSKVDQIACDYTITKCSTLSNPTNGIVTYSSDAVGASATYSCDTGYTPDSSTSRTCSSDGSWDGSQPSCDPVDCLSAWSITNGEVSVTGTTYLNTASYACKTGYILSGSAVSVCQDDGVWDGVQPACNPVDCLSPWSITNGNVIVTGTTYLNTASYACKTGYILSGSAVSVCQDDGEWDGVQPACNPVDCLSPWSITNGNVIVTGTTYLKTASYACNIGYILSGSAVSVCQDDGNWDGVQSSCNPVDCLSPSSITNGNVIVTGTTYLNTATYTCIAGYTLSGTDVSTCEADNSWDGTQPNCNPVYCGTPLAIPNGSFNVTSLYYLGTAIYTCDIGYILYGNSLVTCQVNGSWSDANPSCDPVVCDHPQNITNGNVNVTGTTYQHFAVYSCDSGHSLVGPDKRSCNYDGNWTESDPYCVIDCGDPVDIADGFVSYNSTYLNSTAFNQCNTNCTLVGDNHTTCLADGSWNTTPSCSCPVCPPLSDPVNGTVSTSNGNHAGSIASYSCTPGFVLSHVNVRTCMPLGTWTSTESTCDIHVPEPGTPSRKAIYIIECHCNENREFESLSQEEIIELLVQDTKIDEKSTALAQQKLKCANDPRQSSRIIGTLGISIVSVMFGFFIVMDCLSMCKKICKPTKDDV